MSHGDAGLGSQTMVHAEKRFVVDEHGRKTAVILPIEQYEELMEDLDDLATIAERRGEPTEPIESVRERLEEKWQSIESR